MLLVKGSPLFAAVAVIEIMLIMLADDDERYDSNDTITNISASMLLWLQSNTIVLVK